MFPNYTDSWDYRLKLYILKRSHVEVHYKLEPYWRIITYIVLGVLFALQSTFYLLFSSAALWQNQIHQFWVLKAQGFV